MKNVKTEEAKKRIEEIEANRKKGLEELETLKEENESQIAEANKKMEEATEAGDLEAYQKAKAELRNALDAKEMYNKRYNAFLDKALITKAEYNKLVTGILEECAALDNKAKEKLAALANQMLEIGLELQETFNGSNHILAKLQHDIYKDEDRTKNAKGVVMNLSHERKAYTNYDTVAWAKAAAKHYSYEKYTGNKITEEKGARF